MSTPQQSVGASLIRRLSARGAVLGQVLSFCLLMLPIVGYSMWAEWNLRKDRAALPTVAYGQGIGGPPDGAHPRLGIPAERP